MRSRILIIVILTISPLSMGPGYGGDSRWFFSAREIEIAYKYQEQFGERLSEYWEPKGCFSGKSEFTASYLGTRLQVPCAFVREIRRHLKDILDLGAGKYIFALDLGHAYLAVPREAWEEKYSKLTGEELYAEVLENPQLMALYHTADHL